MPVKRLPRKVFHSIISSKKGQIKDKDDPGARVTVTGLKVKKSYTKFT